MGRSRYSNTRIIDGNRYATFAIPAEALGYREFDLFRGVRTFEHVFSRGERLDHLAARYFGDDSYWWVIALGNGIAYPFASGGLTPGRTLRIPFDVKDALAKILK